MKINGLGWLVLGITLTDTGWAASLSLSHSNGAFLISWPVSSGLELQENLDPKTDHWYPVTTAAVMAGETSQVSIRALGTSRFFRLKQGVSWVQTYTPLRRLYVGSDGTDPLIVEDYSGNGIQGRWTHSPSWLTGLVQAPAGESWAVALDGVQNYLALPAPGVCPWGQDATIEAWIKTRESRPDPDKVPYPILGQWEGLSMTGVGQAFGLEGGQLAFSVSESGASGCGDNLVEIKGSAINDGRWHFVATTIEHSPKRVKLYLDGHVDASGSISEIDKGCEIKPMRFIGATGGWPYHYLDAALDELRVYNRVLSENEILDHYQNGHGQYGAVEPGLAAGWHFDEGEAGAVPYKPISLPAALRDAQAGDEIWVLEGTYTGSFSNNAHGTVEHPIVYRANAGYGTIIHGDFAIAGSNVWLWGFQLTDPDGIGTGDAGVNILCGGAHVINNYIHHQCNKMGMGGWNQAPVQAIYGNIVFDNGTCTNRNPHGIYAQNNFEANGYKYIINNMFLDANTSAGNRFNVHIYATCSDCEPLLTGLWVERNIVRNGRFLLGGLNQPVSDCLLRENYFYGCGPQLGYGRPTQLEFVNNYIARGEVSAEWFWTDASSTVLFPDVKKGRPNIFTGNTILLPANEQLHVRTATPTGSCAGCTGEFCTGCVALDAADTFDFNTYSEPFWAGLEACGVDIERADFSTWKITTALAGNPFDAHSSVVAVPSAPRIVLLPNEYELGRAHVAVYNWDLRPSVTVDLSRVLQQNDPFQVHSVDDLVGPAVLSSRYTGPVVLPTAGKEFLLFLVRRSP